MAKLSGERKYLIPEVPFPWGVWFAWYPVRLTDDRRLVWLRTIERRTVWFIYFRTQYRTLQESHPNER